MTESKALLFAILAGIFTTIEASINAKLGSIVTPKIATLHNLVTGTVIILVANFLKNTLNQYAKIIFVSPQWLIGGVFGAFIIYFATKSVPKLGVSNTLIIIVASQIISGLFIDIVLTKQYHLGWIKMIGISMVIVGIFLIAK
ncbi:DMT family transporter [Petroclostridium sp. X23]|uniref:DMT family transporter n=1 Tax=Petroclostridium sp. X23 TaxID=3045146 RepID=UPI0024AE0019|nr:DMT family transporter [Petroclostridium sp. X23]WHH60058.1 DMT family transporter [Petroclostridium sp. X23]